MSASITLVDPPAADLGGYKYTKCDRCGTYHGPGVACPRRAAWEPVRDGERVPHVRVTLVEPQAAREPLRPSWTERASARCATLVVRASSAFRRRCENRTEKKETGAMSELLIKNMKGHTGRHVGVKDGLSTRIKRRTNTGVIALVAMVALALGS